VLLAAVLAPTDPVLASDVQVERPSDTDRLRFGLTGEAGFNDGTAFPFVLLGLGLLGLHPLGDYGGRWLALDGLWAVAGGIGVGWAFGGLVARLVVYLRHRHKEGVGLDDFLALGLIALSYGAALALRTYGFLAVFAAGLALRRVEAQATGDAPPVDVAAQALTEQEELATSAETAPAFMASAVLHFTEALERIAEVAVMVLVGALVATVGIGREGLVVAGLLFLVARPASVALAVLGSNASASQRALMSWFGIRGVGSLYYLFYAIVHGLPAELAERLVRIVLTVVVASAVLHGVSVTPFMKLYERRWGRVNGARRAGAGRDGTGPIRIARG
jgi:sodium/hydrogen antiporter